MILAAILSVGAWLLLQVVAPPTRIRWTGPMAAAAERMARGMELTAAYCTAQGIPLDPALDPNGTCLVGPEYTPLVTSLGQIEAKRSTLNPNMAGLLVHLLKEAGVSEGDRVAVGASGSFPGLLLASLTAVEAVGAEAVVILSLGASSYGATRPELHLLDLYGLWEREGVVGGELVGVSLGGAGDVGGEFDPATRAALTSDIRAAAVPFIQEPELAANVAERMDLYGPVAAFVNVGGALVNLGSSPLILRLPPGLNRNPELPPAAQRGVLFQMAAGGVPVIHLLHVRGLVQRYGLRWDPVPTPGPGDSTLQLGSQDGRVAFWLLTGGYLTLLLLVFLFPATVRLPTE